MRRVWLALIIATGLGLPTLNNAGDSPKSAERERVREVYKVEELVNHMPSGDSRIANCQLLVSQIVNRAVQIDKELLAGDGISIEIRNDVGLAITASKAHHKCLRAALEDVRKSSSFPVLVESRLLELDGSFYRTRIKPALEIRGQSPERPFAAAPPSELLALIEKNSTRLSKNTVLVPCETEADCLSFFRINPVERVTGDGKGSQVQLEISGIQARIRCDISRPDHEIRMTVKQKTTDISDKSISQCSFRIAELDTVAIVLHYRSAEMRRNDRIWLLMIQPAIFDK